MARLDEVLAGEATWGAWALDQLGHVGLGTAYALPGGLTIIWPGWPVPVALGIGLICALAGGVLREVVGAIKTDKPHPLDRSVDALFHLPGAVVALGIVLIIREVTL